MEKTAGIWEKNPQEGLGEKGGNVPILVSIGAFVPAGFPTSFPFPDPLSTWNFDLKGSGWKKPIPTFSPLSPRAPGAPISPWKTINPKNPLFQGIFPSLLGGIPSRLRIPKTQIPCLDQL